MMNWKSVAATAVLGLITLGGTAQAQEALIVTAKLHVTPGREAEAEARLVKVTEFVRKTELGVTFRVFHSNSDRTLFSTFEVYPNSQAFSTHFNAVLPAFANEAGLEPEGLYSGPMEVEYWQELSK